jgi:hypothetical protein
MNRDRAKMEARRKASLENQSARVDTVRTFCRRDQGTMYYDYPRSGTRFVIVCRSSRAKFTSSDIDPRRLTIYHSCCVPGRIPSAERAEPTWS